MLTVLEKTNETIDIIDNSYIIKRLKELNRLIDNDKEVKLLINDFNKYKDKYYKDNIINDDLISSKKELYNHKYIDEYLKIYNSLNLSIISFNKKLSLLLKSDIHRCSRK